MELANFNHHSPKQKQALVKEHGKYLAVRLSRKCWVRLYHMGKFFAEVWGLKFDNKAEIVVGFQNKTQLAPFLEMVDLSAIIR